MLNSPLYGKISFNELLSLHTSMKVGGPARIWVEPQTEEQLRNILAHAKNNKISFFPIGAGCNIIAKSKGIDDAICIRLNAPCFKTIKFNGVFVKTGSGVLLSKLIAEAAKRSLGGYEFLAGIPGTVGGAIFGNAGDKEAAISSLLKEIEVIDTDSRIKKIKKENINFSYRESGLTGYIIIKALFKFEKKNKKDVNELLRKNLQAKKQKQDYAFPSAGCIFKNPKDFHLSAGELIDRCGLKGRLCGGAQISSRHANFIINKNNAKAQDILALIALIKKEVAKTYGIELEEEVKII